MSIDTVDEMKSTLELEAIKRKERLAALKRKAQEKAVNGSDENDENKTLQSPKFRSYRPEDEYLKEKAIEPAKPIDVEIEIQDELINTTNVIEDLDFKKLVPKKPDWDLKRDIEKKLEKLERRTNRAIAELIRERLKGSENDLVASVNLGVEVTQKYNDDDDK